MKKYVVGIVLLVLLVVVSYVKMQRQESKESSAYDSGVRESQTELTRSGQKIDSLVESAGNREVSFADSITSTHQMYQSKLDSANRVLDAQESEISSLEGDLKKAQAKQGSSTASRASKKKPTRHQRILSSYQKKYKALPLDLSKYERKIAVAEIRQETANDFDISISDLRRIREKYNLNY